MFLICFSNIFVRLKFRIYHFYKKILVILIYRIPSPTTSNQMMYMKRAERGLVTPNVRKDWLWNDGVDVLLCVFHLVSPGKHNNQAGIKGNRQDMK